MSGVASIELILDLETDVSLRESNRTLGSVGTLTWLPGRVLWGAAAAAAYRSGMAEAEAFRLFHRGRIRFRDAVPLAGDARCYPVPRSWHLPKGSDARSGVRNLAVGASDPDIQWQPVAEGWLTVDASVVTVRTEVSMRTALDRTGRAREGLLHTLPVIRAGTRFWTTISGPSDEVEAVVRTMEAEGLSLGKSKNTELGRVRVIRAPLPVERLDSGPEVVAGSVMFLCVSRVVLRHSGTGFPTLMPDPVDFGLDPTWRFVPERSFVRSVSVVHFNSWRARPETERLALEKGSVVAFAGGQSLPDPGRLRDVAEAGVGEWRHQGYGEVLVNPRWLLDPDPVLSGPVSGSSSLTSHPEPEDELFRWAHQRARLSRARLDVFERAMALARQLAGYEIPPAQWGALHRKARRARIYGMTTDALVEDLKAWFGSGRRNVAEAWKGGAKDMLLESLRSETDRAAILLEQLANAGMRGQRESAGEAGIR